RRPQAGGRPARLLTLLRRESAGIDREPTEAGSVQPRRAVPHPGPRDRRARDGDAAAGRSGRVARAAAGLARPAVGRTRRVVDVPVRSRSRSLRLSGGPFLPRRAAERRAAPDAPAVLPHRATAAEAAGIRLPPYRRVLCRPPPPSARAGPDHRLRGGR